MAIDYLKLDRRPQWTDTNIEYHRTKTDTGFAVDSAYLKRYYSVVDAEIFFGNEYVEDICNIGWEVNQWNQLLYGYNSYTYDEPARGARYIRGAFSINFTSPNYLFEILKHANIANTNTITEMTSYDVPALGSDKIVINKNLEGSQIKGKHKPMWPETFDIDVILGEKTGAGNPVHILLTGIVIDTCQIQLSAWGGDQGVTPTILESYSFHGQDIKTVVKNVDTVST